MPLVDIEISTNGSEVPGSISAFLREADERVKQFVDSRRVHFSSFVPSDFVTVYHALRAIDDAHLATGCAFCEWGSGFGVVATLAAMLEYDACGIEIERGLVDASRRLADDFGVPVEFVHGSFIPPGGEAYADKAYSESGAEFSWIATDADHAYDELGLEPDDFDLVFAYPWPGEELLIENLFERFAAEGALLLTYSQFDSVFLRRKVSQRFRGFPRGGRKVG